jgi:hypothetical protein
MGSYELVEQALNYINEFPDFVEFVKNFNEPTGFMWSLDQRIFTIFDAIHNVNHSPTSFALTLRVCQNIYRGQLTLEQYKGLLDEQEQHAHAEPQTQAQKRIFH